METNFILQGTLEDLSICDRIIEYHANFENKAPGKIFEKGQPTVNLTQKNSLDVAFFGPLVHEYADALQVVVEEYIKKYHYCNESAPWKIIESVNIQQYPPGGGYYRWHYERNSAQHLVSSRHLVFMTYLNDVTDGGETEFFYQNIKIQPKKGLTLIWPADWTHTHRGITSPTQEKYIVTGWFSFTQ